MSQKQTPNTDEKAVLHFARKLYARIGTIEPEELPLDFNGYFRSNDKGVHLYDRLGTVGAYIVNNQRQGKFVVTAFHTDEGIRYMYSTCSDTEKWLGIWSMSGEHEAIEAIRYSSISDHKSCSVAEGCN